VRSLAMLLALFEGVRLVFVAPDHPKLAMREDLRERLVDRNVRFYEMDSFDEVLDGRPVIEQLDALYMTRIQKEHDDPQDKASMADIDFSRYCLTPELVGRMKEYAPILHPFPRDQHFGEIPPEIDNDPRAMYFRQARNGMWIRAALLAHVFDVDHHISRHFLTEYVERHSYND
jgi:aspartate carbamoyltransferase catalytic subunit